jgi:hypothetical protein
MASPPHEPSDGAHQLIDACVWIDGRTASVCHADADVSIDESERDLLERRLRRRYLGDHIDAVAILIDHACDPAELPFDAGQTVEELLL